MTTPADKPTDVVPVAATVRVPDVIVINTEDELAALLDRHAPPMPEDGEIVMLTPSGMVEATALRLEDLSDRLAERGEGDDSMFCQQVALWFRRNRADLTRYES